MAQYRLGLEPYQTKKPNLRVIINRRRILQINHPKFSEKDNQTKLSPFNSLNNNKMVTLVSPEAALKQAEQFEAEDNWP